jgi:excisionase family DNA binding protein
MNKIVFPTPEEIEEIIYKSLTRYFSVPNPEPKSESDSAKYLHSIRELAKFLGCSIVTAQKLKNSGEIRYRQFGRKVLFIASEVLEDIQKNHNKINKRNKK